MHLAPLIQDLAVILGVAGLMSLIFQKLRQPVVLGYILAGMIVGPYTPPFQIVTDVPSIQTWAELGVIFLMFSLGLEFSFRKLARVGASAGITATTEVLFFLPVGYFVARLFGWSSMDGIFLGAMLAISSTTIIIKALEELKLKTRHFAELIFGVLIVEDLFAILLLVGLTTIATTDSISGLALLLAAGKLVLVVGSWFIVGYFVVPRFMRYVGGVANNEMLTLLSLGLCLGLVVFATQFHYSTALGAFIMGSILAETPLLHRIESRMEPLRDLFGAIFFVSIGMLIDPKILWEHKGVIAILCAITIVGKIVSTGLGALVSGQTFKNSLQVGFGLAQIGEFSFIIATVGMTLDVTSPFLYPIAVAVSLVTTFTTPYLIKASGPAAEHLEKMLPERFVRFLNRYAARNEARQAAAGLNRGFYITLTRWLINALLVSAIFVVASEVLIPYFKSELPWSETAILALGWVASVVASAPFIWGMTLRDKNLTKAALFGFRGITLALIVLLSFEFFPARTVAIATSLGIVAFLALFYRRLENAYRWFESNFLSTFEKSEGAHPTDTIGALAPWDARLVRIRVHPNSAFSGKKIVDLSLRNRFGLNVVAIQRGIESIVAPKPDESLFPQDELLVLATDESVEKVRPFLEAPSDLALQSQTLGGYDLKYVKVSASGALRPGVSIRNSGIRENYSSMVVGLERREKRIMSPDSDLVLEELDIVWLVGPTESLTKLQA